VPFLTVRNIKRKKNMIAIVTDKPNVGREIARVLGADRKENGYMSGNGYMVTWTYGNMLSLAMPKDTGTAWVERENFPLLPPPFLTVRHVKTDTGWNPDINAVLQLKVIAGVFDACDTIVAFGAISAYVNHYSSPRREWNVGMTIGWQLFNYRFVE
jgi:hypothetical protein